jgi:hypothetical protein
MVLAFERRHRDQSLPLCTPYSGIRRRCEMPCWSRAQFSDRCILPFHREQLELQGEKKNRMVTSKFGIGCASMSMERRRVRRRHDSSNREHAREEEKGGCRVWGRRGPIPTPPPAKSKDMVNITLPYRRLVSQCIAHLAEKEAGSLKAPLKFVFSSILQYFAIRIV